MKQSIYEYRDYKKYLLSVIKSRVRRGRGERARLAQTIKCHTTYVSQVLNSNAHFNLEQAAEINNFLCHDKDEAHFFILLVELARAGTETLKKYFQAEIQKQIEKRLDLKSRLKFQKTLEPTDQSTYCSSWHYAAVNILLTIPEFQTKPEIARYLKLPLKKVTDVLEFLTSVGLIIEEGGHFKTGAMSMHMGSGSPMLAKHHINWRFRAIASLDEETLEDLHYTSVITLSKSDIPKVRAILVRAIEEVREIVRPSKEEEAYCYLLDLFPLSR